MSTVKLGDKVVWNQDGERTEGYLKELTLWRRGKEIMAKVVSKGRVYWVNPDLLKSVHFPD